MAENKKSADEILQQRRQCLCTMTKVVGVAGIAVAAWPLVSALGPDEQTVGESEPVAVALAGIAAGQTIRRIWQGKLIFIHHRTADEIAAAQAARQPHLIDPQADSERVNATWPQWLVVEGSCPHAGCVPNAKAGGGGWVCPCHGSEFDTSGRVTRGPATANLAVPDYTFSPDGQTVLIGVKDT